MLTKLFIPEPVVPNIRITMSVDLISERWIAFRGLFCDHFCGGIVLSRFAVVAPYDGRHQFVVDGMIVTIRSHSGR